jgi:hypothetical protein
VVKSTKLVFVINPHTAHELGIEVPSGMLSIADEVIECFIFAMRHSPNQTDAMGQ